MESTNCWRWEQDGAGGDNGLATFFPGTNQEITVPLCDFRTAYGLHRAVAAQIKAKADAAARQVRMDLLRYLESKQGEA